MAFSIKRNAAGNCITFEGASQPVYWNACLSAEVVSGTDLINVINDVKTARSSEDQYEFFRLPFTDFADADGVVFTGAQQAVDYINANANVLGLSEDGTDLTNTDVNFRLDDTSTSIIMDNGFSFGVNTIKAVGDADGTIHIHAIAEGVPSNGTEVTDREHFNTLDHTRVSINGSSVAGGLQDVVNSLNELFTVGSFEAVVISDPYSTMVADVSGVSEGYSITGSTAVDPVGSDIFTNSSAGNYAGLLSSGTIDQAGEYFTFDIRGEGQIGFGLVHTQSSYDAGYFVGNSNYADPTTFATQNSAHYGYQFSHWFHPTPNGPWTNYGANTSYIQGPGWTNTTLRFSSSDEGAEWLAGNAVKMKVGLDANGFIEIAYYDVSETSWVMCARTSYPVPEGSEFRLGIKAANSSPRVFTEPKSHLLEPAAPTMYFRYIESPDGQFAYPLFATTGEASYYDSTVGGSGTYHSHVYPDDPTFATWYMPDTSGVMNAGAAPTNQYFTGNAINYTEISTLTNADLVPPAYPGNTVTVDEFSAVNVNVHPAGATWTTTIGGIPAFTLVGGNVEGTAPEVTGDYVNNPSDTTQVTIYRTNSYGTSSGFLDINITNLTAPAVPVSGFSHVSGSSTLVDSDTLDAGSAVTFDDTVEEGKRFIIPRTWVEANVLPNLQASGNAVLLGVADGSADWTTVENADFDFAIKWEWNSASSHTFSLINVDGASSKTQVVNSTTSAFYDFGIEVHNTDVHLIACNVNSINNEPAVNEGGFFTCVESISGYAGTIPLELTLATVDTQMDLSLSGIDELSIPLPSNGIAVVETSETTATFDGAAASSLTLNAGSTYRFYLNDDSIESGDTVSFTLADGTTPYTTGVTTVGTHGEYDYYVEFVVPSDVPPLKVKWNSGTAESFNIAGSTYVTSVTGVTLEGPAANQTGTNLFDTGDHGWLSIDETLSAGERLVLSNTFLADLVQAMPDNSSVQIGLKDSSWTDAYSSAGFEGLGYLVIQRQSASDVRFRLSANGSSTSTYYTTSGVSGWAAFIDLTNSGNNIRLGMRYTGSDDVSTTTYADWSTSMKVQTGDQGYGLTSVDVVILGYATAGNSSGMNSADVTWTNLSEVSIPVANTILTDWNKALDFSGSNERALQVTQDSNRIPMKMNGQASLITGTPTSGYTSNNSSAKPWATAVVFKIDGNNSNQHIWNVGEGAGDNDDNIYLRVDSAQNLYFGWGRQGALNECRIATAISSAFWYAVYIGHDGRRWAAAGATAGNLYTTFDIRMMSGHDNFATSWDAGDYNAWNQASSTTGGRMDRNFTGPMSIGGRDANRSFHGKVASYVTTTLRRNQPMPTAAEIEMMITDPKKWLQDYKVGQDFRLPWQTSDAGFNFSLNDGSSAYSTQVWLMGDGTSDSYSNMIRNQVQPSDQNYTKLNLISMVSNDIETISIQGLT